MINNWNKTAKLKAIIIGISFLISILIPIKAIKVGAIEMLSSILSGAISIPLIIKGNNLFFSQIIEKPKWNDNPLSLKRPLGMFQFGAYFFIFIGIGLLIGTLLRYQSLQELGIYVVLFGMGILAGIFLSLRLKISNSE